MQQLFNNDIIYHIRDYINGNPKENFKKTIKQLNTQPILESYNETTKILKFRKMSIEPMNYYLLNLNKNYMYIFHDIQYKKCLKLCNKTVLFCKICKKKLQLNPIDKMNFIDSDMTLLITLIWIGINTDYCYNCI